MTISALEWRHATGNGQQPPLSLQNVHINYGTRRGAVQAVRGVSLDLHAGESLALIGESGSGKTTLGLSIVRLLANTARVSPGKIIYRRDGREVDVLALNGSDLREFRWRPEEFGISQQPLADLAVDGPAASAKIIRSILDGEPGPARDIVLLNAAAGLIAAGISPDPKSAASRSAEAIDSGRARELLNRLAARSHEPA